MVTNTTQSLRNLIPVALMALLAFGAGAAQAQRRVPPELVARASREGAVRIIVQLDVPTRPEGRLLSHRSRLRQRERIVTAQEGLQTELAGTAYRTARRFRSIPFTALEVGPRALARLERSSRVLAVQEDRLHRPALNVSAPLVEADQAAAMGSDGSGQTVVSLDTGVDAGHPNLAGKIVGEACFARGDPELSGDCPNGLIFDDGEGAAEYCDYSTGCFHGTHVAGIAIGAGASYPGVAPGATLIPIQVFSEFTGPDCDPDPSPCPLSYASDQVAALEYVFDTLRPLHTIASVNMSLGGDIYSSQAACDAENAATKAAIDNLRSAGIATVIAAGNDGNVNAISEPGCISSAISVSATDDDDEIWNFSNAADFLSLWAPGVSIRAPLSGTTGFIDADGTSMATAHVAGAWAILRQAAPSAAVDEILAALQDTGVPIPDEHADTSRIRIAQARLALLPECSNGLDDDADGYVDFPEDPGCGSSSADREDPRCQDGVDNDGDGKIDFDGGASVNGGVPITEADPGCVASWGSGESRGCGLGVELALLIPLLAWLLDPKRATDSRTAAEPSARWSSPLWRIPPARR